MSEMVGVGVMNFELTFCPKLFSDLLSSQLHRLLARILATDATEVIRVVAIEIVRLHLRIEET